MYLFCGDSHSRQFRTDLPGNYCNTVFSGATLKGLVNDDSKLAHGRIIRGLAALRVRKSLILMFGGVDMDFSFYRKSTKETVDIDAFAQERLEALNAFLTLLVERLPERKILASVTVLAPQATPVPDDYFVGVTANNAKVEASALRALRNRLDLSHAARNLRIRRFNDVLETGIITDPRVQFFRIDRDMTEDDGTFRAAFRPDRARDHHARPQATLPLWAEHLKTVIPRYARLT